MNSSKHFIEDYREHKIWYNEDTDKFTVELLVEDSWREKGRKSLKECKQAIDAHVKENLEFKPLFAIRKSWSNATKIKIEQVRSDGGFIFSTDTKEKQTEISDVIAQLNGKEYRYFNYDANYIDWLTAKKNLEFKQSLEMTEFKKTEPKLTPLDLSFVNQFIKP